MIKQNMLLIYLAVFVVYLALKSVIFYKKFSINPFAFSQGSFREKVQWLGLFFILVIFGIFISLFYMNIFGPVFENIILDVFGYVILLKGFILFVVSHAQMGKSWRMGNDKKTKTKLVTSGLFKISRNPVYLSLLAQALGITILLLNITTIIIFILLLINFNLVIKNEEKFLEKKFGKEYIAYKKRVRRFI